MARRVIPITKLEACLEQWHIIRSQENRRAQFVAELGAQMAEDVQVGIRFHRVFEHGISEDEEIYSWAADVSSQPTVRSAPDSSGLQSAVQITKCKARGAQQLRACAENLDEIST
jgi:hypothetical protein